MEYYSALRTDRAVHTSDVCVVMVDATEGELHHQDVRIAELVEHALRLEGLNRHASTHAAGIVTEHGGSIEARRNAAGGATFGFGTQGANVRNEGTLDLNVSSVISAASAAGTTSSTSAKQPACCSRRASARTAAAFSSPRPCTR